MSIGYSPDIILIPNIDETPKAGENPVEYVLRMAVNKSKKINKQIKGKVYHCSCKKDEDHARMNADDAEDNFVLSKET